MKRLSSICLFLLCFTAVSALQVSPLSLHVENATGTFEVYVSHDAVFQSTCPDWFTYDGVTSSIEFAHNQTSNYGGCQLYFHSASGPESVRLPVTFASHFMQNDTADVETEISFPQELESGGVELLVETPKQESTLAKFVGGIQIPSFRPSTIGGIVFILFIVSVVFLLIPKT